VTEGRENDGGVGKAALPIREIGQRLTCPRTSIIFFTNLADDFDSLTATSLRRVQSWTQFQVSTADKAHSESELDPDDTDDNCFDLL